MVVLVAALFFILVDNLWEGRVKEGGIGGRTKVWLLWWDGGGERGPSMAERGGGKARPWGGNPLPRQTLPFPGGGAAPQPSGMLCGHTPQTWGPGCGGARRPQGPPGSTPQCPWSTPTGTPRTGCPEPPCPWSPLKEWPPRAGWPTQRAGRVQPVSKTGLPWGSKLWLPGTAQAGPPQGPPGRKTRPRPLPTSHNHSQVTVGLANTSSG